MIDFNQQQQIQMTPNIQRSSSSSTTITNLMGLERQAENLFSKKQHEPGKANPSWLDLKSNPSLTGKAQYQVNDQMKFSLATYVIQILPNGNMVIQGRQEARLVNELREIEVKGIVRPEDITSNNTIAGHKVAELRVSYGGRGELTDAQSAPIGQQLLNKVMPF
jgi:flagellar L-ring protein precursor FlgH